MLAFVFVQKLSWWFECWIFCFVEILQPDPEMHRKCRSNPAFGERNKLDCSKIKVHISKHLKRRGKSHLLVCPCLCFCFCLCLCLWINFPDSESVRSFVCLSTNWPGLAPPRVFSLCKIENQTQLSTNNIIWNNNFQLQIPRC